MCPLCIESPTANNNCKFRDETADTGDQLNSPVDLYGQMSFDVCGSTFMSEQISSGFYDAESSHR